MKDRTLIFVIISIILTVLVVGYLVRKTFLPEYFPPEKPSEKPKEGAFGVPAEFNIPTNPMEKAPNINPVEKANPFKSLKTNPFE